MTTIAESGLFLDHTHSAMDSACLIECYDAFSWLCLNREQVDAQLAAYEKK